MKNLPPASYCMLCFSFPPPLQYVMGRNAVFLHAVGGGGGWQTCDHHGSWRCAATSFPSWRCALEVISVSTEFSLQGLMKKKNSPRLFAVSFLFSDDSPGVKLHMCICNITVALVPTCPLIWATVLVVCFSLTHLTQMSPYRWQEATQPDAVS